MSAFARYAASSHGHSPSSAETEATQCGRWPDRLVPDRQIANVDGMRLLTGTIAFFVLSFVSRAATADYDLV